MYYLLYILLCLLIVITLAFLFIIFFLMDTPSLRIFYRTIARDLRGAVVYIKLHGFFFISYFRNLTLVDYFNKHVEKTPNEVCFMFEDEEWTYKQMGDLSNKIARCFLQQGYQKGDEVALLMENCPDYICVWLGLAKIGVVTALINTNQKLDSLVHSLNIINLKGIVFSENFIEVIEKAMPYITKKDMADFFCYERRVKKWQTLPLPFVSLNNVLENTSADPLDSRRFKTNFKEIFLYIYTSGTTGLPKAAVMKHSRCIFMVAGAKYSCKCDKSQIIYNTLPLYHVSGCILCTGIVLVFGGKMVLRKKFSASNFWKDVVKYKVTMCQYIGEICRYLLNHQKVPEETQHSVQLMFGNGLRPHIWKEFQERFRIKKIIELYGATEGNTNIVNIDGKVGAVGFISRIFSRIHAVYLVKINPETGEIMRDSKGLCIRCKPGEPGELVGKVAGILPIMSFDGYVNQADSNKKIIRDCFRRGDMAFSSGDILVMDEDGYLFFKDRTGDTFRWKGENVSTSEVEIIISKIMGLSTCIVYGVKIPSSEGCAGMAAIQENSENVDFEKLYQDMAEVLPSYAIPLFLRFSSYIEVTGTHKLRKVNFQNQGYDPEKIDDALYVLNSSEKTYVPLTKEKYTDVINGKMKL